MKPTTERVKPPPPEKPRLRELKTIPTDYSINGPHSRASRNLKRATKVGAVLFVVVLFLSYLVHKG